MGGSAFIPEWQREALTNPTAAARYAPGTRPPSTQLAVAGAAAAAGDQPSYPTEFARGYGQAQSSSSPVSPDALPKADQVMGPPKPTSNEIAGPVSARSPDRDVPYPNFDAMDRSVFMANVPSMGQGSRVPDFPTRESVVGQAQGRGLFAPSVLAGLQAMQDKGHELMSSGGLVDNWRGRQLLRAHARYASSIAELSNADSTARNAGSNEMNAGTNAFRAANEVPLAIMKDNTDQRGQTLQFISSDMRDRTTRYGYDTQAASMKYNTDAHTALGAPGAQRQDAATRLFLEGRTEQADALAGLGQRQPVPRNPTVVDSPQAQGVFINGEFQPYTKFKADAAKSQAKRKTEIEKELAAQGK
jgi:hypothetical protein